MGPIPTASLLIQRLAKSGGPKDLFSVLFCPSFYLKMEAESRFQNFSLII
jgi:hypothetical protein